MSLLQFVGILALLATGATMAVAGGLWLVTRRPVWGRIAAGTPIVYGIAVVVVALARQGTVLVPGETERFCGFYLDCHLSVRVARVERGASQWTVALAVANDARRAALAPVGLKVELMRADSAPVRLVPMGGDLEGRIEAGGSRIFTVALPAPTNGEIPTLRVTEGYGIDRVIEGALLGDDDALGRHRVRLGL